MIRTLRRLAALAALALAAPALAADKGAPPQPQPVQAQIGLGVSLAPFSSADIAAGSAGAIAPMMVYVPINLGVLRIEPSLGVFTFDPDGADSFSVVALGAGVFYVLRPAKDFTTYAGPRLTLGFVSNKDATSGLKSSGTDVRLDAAVGGEWWASGSFALGAEARLGYVGLGAVKGNGVTVRPGASSFQTAGLLFLRFYL